MSKLNIDTATLLRRGNDMKKIFILCTLSLLMITDSVLAAEQTIDFENFTTGTYTQEKLTELTPGFSWFNWANIAEDESGKYLNTSNDTYLIFPEKSRKVVIGAKMRASDFLENKFPMHFSGGSVDEELVYDTGIFGPNWPAGLGLIPSNSTPIKDPDNIALSAGWNGQISENDNAVYVYKDEWFYAKIEYDHTTENFKVYYSYDGDEYSEVYSETLPIKDNYIMRSVRLSEKMDFDDVSIMCDTDSVYDVFIKNNDGEIIDSVNDEKSFTLYGGIYNYNNRLTENITTVVAVYEKTSGKLLEVKTDEASVETAAEVCLGNFDLEYNSENTQIKFFAFESLDTLIPCCQTKVLK